MDIQVLDGPVADGPVADGPVGDGVGAVLGVGLVVRDLRRVERFYREALGLEVVSRGKGQVVLGAGRRGLLTLVQRVGAKSGDRGGAGLYHTAFLLPARGDLGRFMRHVEEIGVRLDGAADHLVSEAVYLHDPEGNGVEVCADRERGEWVSREGRMMMGNLPLDWVGVAEAGSSGAWVGAPAGTRVGHVQLKVGDLAQAVRFYRGTLGLDLMMAWSEAAFLASGGYHHHLGVNIWHSAGAGVRDEGQAGLGWVEMAAGAGVVARLGEETRDPWGTVIRFACYWHGGVGLVGDTVMVVWAPRVLSLLRVVAALLFMEHGTQKLLGYPPLAGGAGPAMGSVAWVAGLLELGGGGDAGAGGFHAAGGVRAVGGDGGGVLDGACAAESVPGVERGGCGDPVLLRVPVFGGGGRGGLEPGPRAQRRRRAARWLRNSTATEKPMAA